MSRKAEPVAQRIEPVTNGNPTRVRTRIVVSRSDEPTSPDDRTRIDADPEDALRALVSSRTPSTKK